MGTSSKLVSPCFCPVFAEPESSPIIQATGHSITTSALTNRFNPAQSPQQFYASSAPSSTTALQQQQRQTRPQVPLFSQSTGSIPQTPNMVMQGTYNIHQRSSPAG